MFRRHQNVYISAVKCGDHQQYKSIIESYMISTPEGLVVYNLLFSVSVRETHNSMVIPTQKGGEK